MTLRDRIRLWLFKEEILQIESEIKELHEIEDILKSSVQSMNDAADKYNAAQKTCDDMSAMLNRMLNVSVDVHQQPSREGHHGSWAIVSIQGRPEYVQFVNLCNHDARSILEFLKQFKGSNMTIDSPMRLKDELNKWWRM